MKLRKKLVTPKETSEYDMTGDYLMAYRFLYYCRHISLLSDKAYDHLEKQYKTSNRAGYERLSVGSDSEDSYSPHIRALGMYLVLREQHKPEKVKSNDKTTKKIKKVKKPLKRIRRKNNVK